MKNERFGIISMLLLLPALILSTGISYGDEYGEDDHYRERRTERFVHSGERHEDIDEYLDPRRQGRLRNFRPAVQPADNLTYIGNCSDCHLAYSPNLLPAWSWEKLLSAAELEDHFGEFISIEDGNNSEILSYLASNSAEKARSALSKKILRQISRNDTPIRISELSAIAKEHDGIPDKYTIHNAKVVSLAQCNACHQQVDKGIYKDDDVFIPYEPLPKQ